jgi:hypothetical protein
MAHVFFVSERAARPRPGAGLRIEGEILQQAAMLEPGESLQCRILLEAAGGGPLLYMEVGRRAGRAVLPPLSLDAEPAAIGRGHAASACARRERSREAFALLGPVAD